MGREVKGGKANVALCAALAGAALAAGVAVAAAEPGPLGVWLTEGGKARVEIRPCGAMLCGRIVWIGDIPGIGGAEPRDVRNIDENLRDRPIVGLRVLTGLSDAGGGRWDGGTAYNPEDGQIYRARIEIAGPDTLEIEGCALLFCETRTWTRIE